MTTLDRLTAEIAERARQTVREARALARNARRRARRKRASVALVERLERELEAAEQILAQTDLRLAGQRTIPDRRVSLVDPDARPIRIGSPLRPTQFGYKARVADTAEGFVIADIPSAEARPTAACSTARSRKPNGRGCSCAGSTPTAASAPAPATPRSPTQHRRRGDPAPAAGGTVEHSRDWRRRYRFRNGLEGRISQLKRKGLRRTRLRSLEGAQTWVGGIALAHNLQRMALLT